MNIFYVPNIKNNIAQLSEEEAIHCTRTLRKRVGDNLLLIDGTGGFYEGTIIEAGKKTCTVAIGKTTLEHGKRDFYLHIAIAPTKNISRFEWFLEKATEFGIDEITPLLCKHSERKNIRLDRLNKVILSAAKQSLKAYLPKLNELTKFKDFIEKDNGTHNKQLFIAHCAEGEKEHLKQAYTIKQDCVILIGPEGDFSKPEVDLALSKGFKAITLGKERLRTETAGLAACHAINWQNA